MIAQAIETYTLDDIGNAARFIAQHGNKLRYVPAWGWLVWDGTRWQRDAAGQVMELAKETARSMRLEAATLPSKHDSDLLHKWAWHSSSRAALADMIELAKSDRAVVRQDGDFDRNAALFNCANGTLDLCTGTLWPHDPADNITRLSPVAYGPEARSETWERFLADITQEDTELADYLQCAAGYSLSGETSEKVFFFCYGATGNNGKTTLLEALLYIFGDYGATIGPETLMVKRPGSIPNDVARLAGARYVNAGEPDEGQKLAMSDLKRWTGGDMVTARFMRGEFFDFRPQFKLWFAANSRPDVSETGDAAFSRIRLVPFEAQFDAARQDKEMPRKLQEAAPAILAWAVKGAVRWYQERCLPEPQVMRDAVAAYRAEQDAFLEFIDARCRPGEREKRSAVNAAYQAWAPTADAPSLTAKKLGHQYEQHGYKVRKLGGVWYVLGLELKDARPTADDFPF